MKNILLAIVLAAYTGLAAQSTNEPVVTNFDGTVVAAAEKVKSLEENRKRNDLAIMLSEWVCSVRYCKAAMMNYETTESADWHKLAEHSHINAEKTYNELMQTIKAVELLAKDEKLKKEAQKTKQKVIELKARDKIVKWHDSCFIPKMTVNGTPLQ
jgi:hypothetical protein